LVLCVWFLLVVNTSASDCLERLVPEMIYCVSRGTLNSTHSLTQWRCVLDRVLARDVNKATRCKVKASHSKAKDLGFKAMAKNIGIKADA